MTHSIYWQPILSITNLHLFAGGTDIIACFMGHNWTVPVYKGEIQGLVLGCDMESWDDEGRQVDVDLQ